MEIDPTSLAPFEPPTPEQWRRAVDGVLAKGQDLTAEQLADKFERQLVTTTYDGIRIEPLYLPEDAEVAESAWPGEAPFRRGSSAQGGITDGWEVRQRVMVTGSGSSTAAIARAELERGTTGLWLDLHRADEVGVDLLDRALDGVFLELVPISLDAGARSIDAAEGLVAVWHRRGHTPAEIRGRLGLAPTGEVVRRGASRCDLDAGYESVVDLVRRCRAEWPGVRALVADATPWHAAGACDTEQLGIGFASLVETVRRLDAAGIAPADALAQIELRLAVGADQFLTIATLRAARLIWARIAEVLGVEGPDAAPRIHAVTAEAMMTRYDPWVNMLRSTVACFAAGVGGADAVTVSPHDALGTDGIGSELGRRMARNTQAILLDESHLARVIDPAGGSWYVENLTRAVAEVAWEVFTGIEGDGGFAAGLVTGALQDRCAGTWQRRRRDLATRRVAVTGVSEYPNIDDDVVPWTPGPEGVSTSEISPVVAHRYGEDYEALRLAADEHRRRHGERPEVVLIGIGTPADHTARVTFAKNLFEAGGLGTRLVEVDGDPAQWADILRAQGVESRLVCLCSSDARYGDDGVAAVKAALAAGARRAYLAGRPSAVLDELQRGGVDEFVAMGVDAVDVLHRALMAAGVELEGVA